MGSKNEFFDCTLDDLADFRNGKAIQTEAYTASGKYPVFGANGQIARTDSFFEKTGVIVIGRVGAYCGSVHRVDGPSWVTDNAIVVTPKLATDLRFLYYRLQSLDLRRTAIGSAQPLMTQGGLKVIRTHVPPLPEQRAIAHILGTLDDKIELNRRMNATLEALMRALFKSWFVDFDPVRAKMDGRQPAGMDAETARLFPDRCEETKFGHVPYGWRCDTIKSCCTRIENGGTPKRSVEAYWHPAEVPWLTSGELRQGIVTRTENYVSMDGLARSSAKMWPSMTTVVALYGATAGYASLLGRELCANQACCALIPRDGFACFNFLAVSSSFHTFQQQTRGSAQQNLSQSIVADLPLVIPDHRVARVFESRVKSLFQHCIANILESERLATLRDTLLPKLLSGEVRVPEAERQLESSL